MNTIIDQLDIPVVDAINLTKTFTGPPRVDALIECSLTVMPGEFVAITGASGSGKTTMLSVLGLLEEPSSGHYFLNGTDVSSLTDNQRTALRSQHLGFIFQSFHLVNFRSVIDNVELGLIYQHATNRSERRKRTHEALISVGLTHRADALCNELSGGERQRVAIARAIVRQPSLILCDEPTGNLDSETGNGILDHFESMHSNGATIIIITHDLDVARRAERWLEMKDGHLNERVLT